MFVTLNFYRLTNFQHSIVKHCLNLKNFHLKFEKEISVMKRVNHSESVKKSMMPLTVIREFVTFVLYAANPVVDDDLWEE